ncbi:hypothetical protein YC2023_091337 [Brassica napus]
MAELHELTHQFISCAATPTESEARRQRVLRTEEQNLMAVTAANIVATASARASERSLISPTVQPNLPQPQLDPTLEDHSSPASPLPIQATSRGNNTPRRTPMRRRIGTSPRVFAGAGSTRRLISRAQAQPSRQGFPFASPIQPRAHTRHGL